MLKAQNLLVIFTVMLCFVTVALNNKAYTLPNSEALSVTGLITPPGELTISNRLRPAQNIYDYIPTLLNLAFFLGIIFFFLYIIYGGFAWLTSSGDKKNLGSAQSILTNAFIGLVLLSLAFATAKIFEIFLIDQSYRTTIRCPEGQQSCGTKCCQPGYYCLSEENSLCAI